MAVIKYKNPKYTEGGSEPKYIVIPTLTMENDEVYVGTTEPTEGEKIWVNPSNGLTKYKNGESWEDLVPEVDLSNYLAKDNSTEYIPSGEYNPSTKGYVDDKWFDINALLSEGEKYSEPTDITEFVNSTYGSIENLRENILLHKQLYRSHIGNNVEVIAASPNLYHIVGKYAVSDRHYKYMHFDLQANDDNTSITIYKIGELYEIVDGDGTKSLMDNGQYKKVVTLDPISATSITDLPTTNYSIKVTLSAASALSFASTPTEGWECMIDILNNSASDIVQPLPNESGWQCKDTSVTIAAGKVASISVRYIHGIYVVISKGQ